ncbi:hypothetical protein RYH80_11220 [Halobaculum sp. MBLA0147]|uniref:hypothetical protein n=1 Tax=Halobaculum sp. MBLA0147 TaxID=3079934 RepID=UPI0035255621
MNKSENDSGVHDIDEMRDTIEDHIQEINRHLAEKSGREPEHYDTVSRHVVGATGASHTGRGVDRSERDDTE